MHIAHAQRDDLPALLALYAQFKGEPIPPLDDKLTALWESILRDPNHHVLAGKLDGALVCTCVLVVAPNLTHGQRPYALIENVITDAAHRNRGYATQMLEHARQIAVQCNCYKIMLMTGSKLESTLNFYRKAGYNSQDKTGFIQWLDENAHYG